MSSRLEEARDLIKAGKLVEALDVLIEEWGANRTEANHALIRKLGALIDRSLAPIETKGVKRKIVEETWFDIAARRRSADLPRLLKVLGWASAPLLKEWTHQLSGFRPDPRIAAPLEKAADRFSSSGAGVTRTAARRLVESLEPPDSDSDSVVVCPPTKEVEQLATRIRAEIDRRMKQPPVSEEVLFASSGRAAVKSAAARGDTLLRMVLDAPSDMQARIVYGDWLSEANDPRGELIALQLQALQANDKNRGGEKERRRRIAELIKTSGSAWIHPLDSVVRGPRFELGFLAGCEEIRFRTKAQRATLLQHPLWATVREIDHCNEDDLLVSGALRCLEHLKTSREVLVMLARSKTPPPKLASVEVRFDVEDAEATANDWTAIASVGELKNLKRLRLHVDWGYVAHDELSKTNTEVGLFSWLFRSKLGAQLESLEIDSGYVPAHLAGFLDRLGELKKLRTFVVEATPPYARGGLSSHAGAGGKGIAGAPCPVRWRLTRTQQSTFECGLEVGWPYYNGKLREIDRILAANLRGFPRRDIVPAPTIKYIGRPIKAAELAPLTNDVERLISKFFAPADG
jgi:uncharacterized protein (TIGR02996 family)